jgi:hypothetical protein
MCSLVLELVRVIARAAGMILAAFGTYKLVTVAAGNERLRRLATNTNQTLLDHME